MSDLRQTEPLYVAFCICHTPEVAGDPQAVDREAGLLAKKTKNLYTAT